MDKLDAIKKKIVALVIGTVVILVFSVLAISMAERNDARSNNPEVFRQNSQVEWIMNNVLVKLYAENEFYEKNYSEYIDIFTNDEMNDDEEEIYLETYLRQNFIDGLGDIVNLDALFIDNTTKKQVYFNNGSTIPYEIDEVNLSDYRIWYRVDFDSKGNQVITCSDSRVAYNNNPFTKLAMELKNAYKNSGYYSDEAENSNEEIVETYPDLTDKTMTTSHSQSMIKVPQIKDATFIFTIPIETSGYDSISSAIRPSYYMQSYGQAMNVILGGILIFTILCFLLSFNQIRATKEGIVLDRIWWELRLITGVLVMGLIILCAEEFAQIANEIASSEQHSENIVELIIMVVIISITLSGILICVYWFKSLFKDKWRVNLEKLKIKSIFKRFIIWGKKWTYNLVTIKLTTDAYLKLALVLVINVLVISALVIIFGYWFGSIIYSILLAIVAIKFMRLIQENYEKLLMCTKRLSNGDLDSEIEENLGAFDPLKNELENIRIGFKVAIDDEMKSQKMKAELISNVSHDLKTPLTSMISYIDLLKEEKSANKKKEYLETVERNSLRLKHLIDDLFEVSKANSGDIKLEWMDVDLISLVNQTLFECKPQIDKANIKFKTKGNKDKIVIQLDAHKTFRIIENLITNAIKYSIAASRVYIVIDEDDEDVNFSIKNISSEEITFDPNDLVERFVRGDKSRNSEGTGLGLAIAKGFTEAQGGVFKVETDGDYFKVSIRFKKDFKL